MSISITELRANIYNIVDDIIKTGQPIDIERAGKKLRIVMVPTECDAKTSKFERLISRKEAITGSSEDYIHMDWSNEWKP